MSLRRALTVKRAQGKQFIPDPRAAHPVGFRGLPVLGPEPCDKGCQSCVDACPTEAIHLAPLAIDLGRCTLCAECSFVCPPGKISFSEDYRLAATSRGGLVVSEARPNLDPVLVRADLQAIFGRSLKLRSVSAAGCNGCELEMNALANVNFDLGRYGIDFVASPRHADALVLTGPISRNMSLALEETWAAMPEPKFVIAVGACAISGSPFFGSTALDRSFLDAHPPALYVPGCPAHPLTFVSGILDLLGIG
ncbi:MAG: NADH:ubiquinone oxidoreductase [Myxococcota bacterium]